MGAAARARAGSSTCRLPSDGANEPQQNPIVRSTIARSAAGSEGERRHTGACDDRALFS
jgi:hypothetical protein